MDSIVRGQPHQNLLLKCTPLQSYSAFEPDKYAPGLYIFCDKISDPQNMGAIIRSSLFYGVNTMFTSKKFSAPLNPTVSKTSAGAL